MAGRNFDLSIIINALDKTGSTFKSLNKDLTLTDKQLNTIAITSTATFATMIYGLKKATDAAAEQQAAELKLAATMLNSKTYTEAAFESNVKLADSLQWISKYSDEEIISAESMIAMFVKDNNLTQQLTKSTLDLATAKGMDLNSAAQLVAKSVGSSTNALSRYGIEIEGAKGSTERAMMAVQNISNVFGGQAKVATLDYTGQLNLLKKQIGETQESIGTWLLPKLTELSSKIYDNVKSFRVFIDNNKELVSAIGGISLSFIGMIALISSLAAIIPKVSNAFIVLGNILKTHPILAIAAILIPLILNWNKLRDSIDETTKAGLVIGKTMDILKGIFLSIINIVAALGFNFKALYSAISLNFSQAKKDMETAKTLISEIPKTIKDAYNNIDSTTSNSSKKRQNDEISTANIIKKMQSELLNNFINNNKIMTDDEKKIQQIRIDYAYKTGQITIQQYRNELENRVNLLKKNHSDSLQNEENYLKAKQELYDIDKQINFDMVAAKYANEVKQAESQKEYDSQSYINALIAQQEYLNQRLEYLKQHQNDSISAQQEYYTALDLQRQNNEILEVLSQNNIKSGFMLMLKEMQNQQINWYNISSTLFKGFQSSLTKGFEDMFLNIGKGWKNINNIAGNFINMIGQTFIQMSAQLLAQWISAHLAMLAVSTAWGSKEIAINAAVAASKAAAASAWTVFGAVAIGAAVGLGVMALGKQFMGKEKSVAEIAKDNDKAQLLNIQKQIDFDKKKIIDTTDIAEQNRLTEDIERLEKEKKDLEYKLSHYAYKTGTRGFIGGMALVGENGPELIRLPNGSDVLNNAETRNILNSSRRNSENGNAININIDFGGSTFMGTPDEISEIISNKIFKSLKLNAVI